LSNVSIINFTFVTLKYLYGYIKFLVKVFCRSEKYALNGYIKFHEKAFCRSEKYALKQSNMQC